MKSEWRVTSNIIDGTKMYAVYRLRDVNEVDHAGNREYIRGFTADKELAERIARKLNRAEKEVTQE